MSIDAAALHEALERPEVTVPAASRPLWQRVLGLHLVLGPKVYRGRILSHAEFQPFVERFLEWEAGEIADDEAEDLFRDYLRAIRIPPRAVLSLPRSLQLEVMASFFGCQAGATPPSRETRKRLEAQAERAAAYRRKKVATLLGT